MKIKFLSSSTSHDYSEMLKWKKKLPVWKFKSLTILPTLAKIRRSVIRSELPYGIQNILMISDWRQKRRRSMIRYSLSEAMLILSWEKLQKPGKLPFFKKKKCRQLKKKRKLWRRNSGKWKPKTKVPKLFLKTSRKIYNRVGKIMRSLFRRGNSMGQLKEKFLTKSNKNWLP